ncbi:hypothetical protein BASA62_007610 [Batrachochytrium salamandrivorans]|nr:hypothetical protein BASA62_007610 [Batrachochytrium salamandrivorans]
MKDYQDPSCSASQVFRSGQLQQFSVRLTSNDALLTHTLGRQLTAQSLIPRTRCPLEVTSTNNTNKSNNNNTQKSQHSCNSGKRPIGCVDLAPNGLTSGVVLYAQARANQRSATVW